MHTVHKNSVFSLQEEDINIITLQYNTVEYKVFAVLLKLLSCSFFVGTVSLIQLF